MSVTSPIREKEQLENFKNYYYEKGKYRNYALLVMGLNTALRISDILHLQWDDVYDYQHGDYRTHLILKEQKTGKRTQIAINESLKAALSLHFHQQEPESYIFCSNANKGQPISRSQAYRIVREAAEHADISGHISCHSLRKTFGYHAWKQGVPPAMLMSIYNHSSYQITKRYLGIEQDDKDEVFQNIRL